MEVPPQNTQRINKKILCPVHFEPLIRLGSKFDGGYVIPEKLIQESQTLLSLGINDDWLFDKEFQKDNTACSVIAVDHTIGKWFIIKKTFTNLLKTIVNSMLCRPYKRNKYYLRLINCLFFYSFFQGRNKHLKRKVSTHSEGLNISLSDLLNNYCSEAQFSTFLKMDIEGSEYEVQQDLVSHAKKINVIVAEFHHLNKEIDKFNDFMTAISNDFAVVHIHGNNFGCYVESIDFPEVVEITLVNREFLTEQGYSSKKYPVKGLDYPNNPLKKDYTLVFE